MNTTEYIIVTEANREVATGHLIECIELTFELKNRGKSVKMFINSDVDNSLKNRIPFEYFEYDIKDEMKGIGKISSSLNIRKIIVFNLRYISNDLIKMVDHDCKTICIDEFGGRRLDCDAIINPMVDPVFWKYPETKAKIFFGGKYLILPQKIRSYHEKKKVINDRIKQICISMGGVDIYGTTLKIVYALINCRFDYNIRIILGAGFSYEKELSEMICGHNNIAVYRNINNIYDFFETSDLAFCAGGNTLHELACIGTPTIVIPSKKHELFNGKYFEEHGFGVCLEQTESVENDSIIDAVQYISNKQRRMSMTKYGKEICDGLGGCRAVRIMENYE